MDVSKTLSIVPDDARAICRRLSEAGKRGWLVGGCVRDLLKGDEPKDWDIATDAHPKEVIKLFRKVIPTGLQHGTVTVVLNKQHYEVTTLRGEGAYTDGRRPDSVEFVSDIVADLARRDFTFNAMAIDLVEEKLIDPFGGYDDLQRRVLRAVGKADERFTEDGLRILRAARFAATHECTIDDDTKAAMGHQQCLDTFRKVSGERVRDEWLKAMRARKPSIAFQLMLDCGVMSITCPEALPMVGCEQNQWHSYDVWGHTMASLDACEGDPVLRVAAFFHDIGKPKTREHSDKTNDYTFYDHERVGAEIADPIAMRLKFSNDERARIVGLVKHHLICYTPSWSDAAVRRWLRRVTPELAQDLYVLGAADAHGKGRDVEVDLRHLKELERRAEAIVAAGQALSTKDLTIGGRELMRDLGLKPGPMIGEILRALLEQVTDDPEKNKPDVLLGLARELADQPQS